MSFLSAIASLIGSLILEWLNDRSGDSAKVQLGALEYENFAQKNALKRAEAKARVKEIISNLDDVELASRVQSTKLKIDTYTKRRKSY